MKISKWLFWLGLVLSSLFLLACAEENKQPAPAKPEGSAGPKAAEDPATRFKGKTLNLLTWEGYAEPKFTKGFEEKYGVTVKGTYFGTSDELVAKLKSSKGVFDVVSPSTDVARTLIEAGLVAPVDVAKISSYRDLAPALRDMKDVEKDGKVYGVPFTWGPDYLIYDADVIKEEPKSWNIFFDPKYKGKVSLWDDVSNIYLMGQVLGYDKADKGALYHLSDEQLAEIKKKLIELKPQVRKYWATAGELNDLFKNKEVVVAVGWPLTPATLNKEGRNIKAVIPEEGATGWIDRLMIVADSQNKELAELYLDYVTQPKPMALVAEVTNYNIANPKAAEHMSDELKKLVMTDVDVYFKRLSFWQHVKNRKGYNELWNEVKSAK
jgi:putative spermidine/putrescine transport system substrate-binding protein/spermidine/putrescine transport system substrate-binding protein